MDPTFFPTPAHWRAWLEANHETESEVLVGFYKKGSGRRSITWPESVDQALCFGWIDGVRRSLGEDAYTIRFTPRKATSNWSAVNVTRFGELHEAELVAAAGHAAFARRREDRTAIYAYEQEGAKLSEGYENRLRANPAAWDYFSSRPPWYRRTAIHWVVRAKREETRERRLNQLIEDSANGRTIGPLTRPGARQASP
jgi:uncharacterized protein YdeI (YjbR/CyaY-like superfamily)